MTQFPQSITLLLLLFLLIDGFLANRNYRALVARIDDRFADIQQYRTDNDYRFRCLELDIRNLAAESNRLSKELRDANDQIRLIEPLITSVQSTARKLSAWTEIVNGIVQTITVPFASIEVGSHFSLIKDGPIWVKVDDDDSILDNPKNARRIDGKAGDLYLQPSNPVYRRTVEAV